MEKYNNPTFDQALEQALQFLENGKSRQEVLDLFPEYLEQLEEVFSVMALLEKGKETAAPPRELLENIMSQVPLSVTDFTNERYAYRDEKGRHSFINITNQIHNGMAFPWKVVLPVGIIGVVALVIGFSQFSGKTPQYSTESEPTTVTLGVETAANTIDVTVATLLQGSVQEAIILEGSEGDILVLTEDSQAISDFGQVYDENQL